jgi:hypothetical protein
VSIASLLKALGVALAGLALGLWLTEAALSGLAPIAVDRLGQWRFAARAGADDADPYARARVARSGEIPLALGEGVTLTTDVDSQGRALNAACVYKVGPQAPTARYWTLTPVDADGFPLDNGGDRYVMRSTEILRGGDGRFWIWLSTRAHAGNWLPIGGRGAFGLALKLYDPQLGDASVGFERATAPSVIRERCG